MDKGITKLLKGDSKDMIGYACSNCGAKPKEKMKPPSMVKTVCHVCGKPLVVKISATEITVTAKIGTIPRKHKSGYG